MTHKDDTIMDMLKTMAEDNQNEFRARLAACITYKGKIVSVGLNRPKSHPFQLLYGKNKDSLVPPTPPARLSGGHPHAPALSRRQAGRRGAGL